MPPLTQRKGKSEQTFATIRLTVALIGTTSVNFLVSPQEPLQAIVNKRRKLAWFGHVTRHDSLPKSILPDPSEGGRRPGHQRKCWMDNENEWTSLLMLELLTMPSRWCGGGGGGQRIFAESSVSSLDDPFDQGTELNLFVGQARSPED